MTIKACTKEDVDEMGRVLIQSYRENYTYLWFDDGEKYIVDCFGYEKLNAELSDPNAAFFLFYEGQKPVGVMKLNISSALGEFSADAALELERIYIIKEASGKGIGKEAIDFVCDFARERNKAVIWLKAMDSSAAVGFYERRGFAVIGESWLSFPEMKDEYKRMVIMVLRSF